MKKWGIVFSIITAIPALVWAGAQLYMGYTMAKVTHQISSQAQPYKPRKGAFPFVVDLKGDKSYLARTGLAAISNMDGFHKARRVNVMYPVQVRDLLQDGEAMPEADFEDVFVKARAVKLGDAECALLTSELARDCRVLHSDVKARNGQYTAVIALEFIQRDAFFPALSEGTVNTDIAYSYEELQQQLAMNPKGDLAMPNAAARERGKYYARAVRLCDKLRNQTGNCAIRGLSIIARPDKGSSALLMSGTVSLSWLDA